MVKSRNMGIVDLQPIDFCVNREILERISKNKTNERPEIWKDNVFGIFIIADGHHRIYLANQLGKKRLKVNYHCFGEHLLSKEGYEYALDEMRKGVDACRESGIFHVDDMLVQ